MEERAGGDGPELDGAVCRGGREECATRRDGERGRRLGVPEKRVDQVGAEEDGVADVADADDMTASSDMAIVMMACSWSWTGWWFGEGLVLPVQGPFLLRRRAAQKHSSRSTPDLSPTAEFSKATPSKWSAQRSHPHHHPHISSLLHQYPPHLCFSSSPTRSDIRLSTVLHVRLTDFTQSGSFLKLTSQTNTVNSQCRPTT